MEFGVGVGLHQKRFGAGAGIFAGATLDLNFRLGEYFGLSLATITAAYTRAGTAYAKNSAGVWVPFAANIPRITDLGMLIEASKTNSFLNSSAPITQTITLGATGSYCCWVEGSGSATISAGTATITGAGIATSGTPNVISCSVVGTINVTIAGSVTFCQFENGAFPSSRIDTAGVAVTRSTDVCSLTGANFTGWYTNAAAGTLVGYATARDNTGGAATRRAYEINDATASNRMFFGLPPGNNCRFLASQAAATQWDFNLLPTTPVNGMYTIVGACAYASNDARPFGNGNYAAQDTSVVVPAVTQMQIGCDNAGTNLLEGYLGRVAYFPSRLSDAYLSALGNAG